MSDPDNAPASEPKEAPKGLGDLLANFALGPAWARGDAGKPKGQSAKGGGVRHHPDAEPRRRDSKRHERGGDSRFERKGEKRSYGSRGGDDGRRGFQRAEPAPPAPGVRLALGPDAGALHLIAKEVHQVARVYSLFDIAETLLTSRERCRAIFEVDENHGPLIKGRLDDSLFLTRVEAVAHLWKSRGLRDAFLDEETVEVDPPSGNFVAVARCGISGEWLGPPNFHTYQTNLRRMHRERFADMPFDAYSAKVRTERGEEAVNAWLDSMKSQTRWRLKETADESAWMTDAGEAMKSLESAVFDQAFESTRRAEVPASISAANLSPGLLSTLKISGGHMRKHPAMMIPSICKALEAEHLPVFKRKGKLFTGPARPMALPLDAVLAERPARMVEWIRSNSPAKLEGLWQAVLPEGGTAPPAEYAADLFWMLQQGHILLFTDDTLVVQEPHEPTPPAKKKTKKKSKPEKQAAAVGDSQSTDSTEGKPQEVATRDAEVVEQEEAEEKVEIEAKPEPPAEPDSPTDEMGESTQPG